MDPPLTQDASHHQDDCIFRLGDPELNLYLPRASILAGDFFSRRDTSTHSWLSFQPVIREFSAVYLRVLPRGVGRQTKKPRRVGPQFTDRKKSWSFVIENGITPNLQVGGGFKHVLFSPLLGERFSNLDACFFQLGGSTTN